MIDNFYIANFRGHSQVAFENLGRVNLLLGRNNSGKTAVLEALLLFFLPNNPAAVLAVLNEQRGYKPGEENEDIWNTLFYNQDYETPIAFSIHKTPKKNTLPLITNGAPEQADKLLFSQEPDGVVISARRRPATLDPTKGLIESSDLSEKTQGLQFDYQFPFGIHRQQVTSLKGRSANKKQRLFSSARPISFIPARGTLSAEAEAERFSRLKQENQEKGVIAALQAVEPRLKDLVVLTHQKTPMLYGDLGSRRPIPISLMGEGITRMLSIAMTMANTKDGLVLIDEIENGLHYSVLPNLWKMIFETARQFNIQVFAATHSDECIQAASEYAVSSEHPDDLRLFRLDRIKDKTVVTDYSAAELAAAIASEQEVR